MKKTRKVVLSPNQATSLYKELLSATTTDWKMIENLRDADHELKDALGIEDNDIGVNVSVNIPKHNLEVDFSFSAIKGFKLALVQTILGVAQKRQPSTYGYREYTIMPIVRAFGSKMESIVAEEVKGKDIPSEDIDWNEEVVETKAE
jgi:hypothetical protein